MEEIVNSMIFIYDDQVRCSRRGRNSVRAEQPLGLKEYKAG